MDSQGIGGRRGRPNGVRPVRIDFMKAASVHPPRPVSLSGVRFDAKLTPQGPTQAVSIPLKSPPHFPGAIKSLGTGGIFYDAG